MVGFFLSTLCWSLTTVNDGSSSAFLDVDGDGQVTPADAESVLLALNSQGQGEADAEGEPGEVEFEVADGTLVIYDSDDGSIRVQSIHGVTTMEIVSESEIFTVRTGREFTGSIRHRSRRQDLQAGAQGVLRVVIWPSCPPRD